MLSSSNDRSNRASEASTSPSGELWHEVGVLQGAIRAERAVAERSKTKGSL